MSADAGHLDCYMQALRDLSISCWSSKALPRGICKTPGWKKLEIVMPCAEVLPEELRQLTRLHILTIRDVQLV